MVRKKTTKAEEEMARDDVECGCFVSCSQAKTRVSGREVALDKDESDMRGSQQETTGGRRKGGGEGRKNGLFDPREPPDTQGEWRANVSCQTVRFTLWCGK
ncbi:predicted protein [Coccidioides posadasii str. Silveira]|uniref:Predicted protein n=2 Tax=Coccidioides posadasii (strain RMSCC 757 / Silveira) TaxID=443226 RepID=E9DE96_COCPS|nr:predicted protein [Coccidioides posadasii str. Silveira]